jgi:tRNA(Ile)-lysidine synthase
MKNTDLLNQFKAQLTALTTTDAKFTIALSGGLDSVVLLHLFSRLKNISVTAHHVHHGLSHNADYWGQFCQQVALALNIKCTVSKVEIDKQNRVSLEALAREKRYAVLKENLADNSYLVTAHHQDDQLETLLLALKRGAGLTGLQGIVAQQTLEKGYLIRPLLDFSREQLEVYAKQFELQWIEDESNADQRFDRNFIRHSITPLLKERWPSIAKTVARSASHCQAQQTLIDEITDADYLLCQLSPLVINIDSLKQLSEARRKNVLRDYFKKALLNYPSTQQLNTIWESIALARSDAEPKLQLQEHTICRYRNALYLFKSGDFSEAFSDGSEKLLWQGEDELLLCNGKVKLKIELDTQALNQVPSIEVCFRHHLPADFKCKPINRDKSRSIKKLFHEYHVPPWKRGQVPFIFVDGELLEAVGVFRCEIALSHLFRIAII